MIIPAGTKELTDYGIALTAAQINDAELQANKDQPNGYAGLDANGDLVGPIVLADVTNEVLADNAIALRNGSLVAGDGTTAGGVWAAMPVAADSFVVVERGATDAASGTNLLAAYTAAKALTPGGNALSATNRAAVLVPPGRYDTGDTALALDTQYVDIVGIGPRDSAIITSSSSTANTVEQTADNVVLQNLLLSSAGTKNAYHPDTDLAGTVLRDVTISAAQFGMRQNITYSGSYYGLRFADAAAWPKDAVLTGLLDGAEFLISGVSGTVLVGSGAKIRNSRLLGSANYSISAASAVSIEITNTYAGWPGISPNVTNTNTADPSRVAWSMAVGDAATDLTTGNGQAWCVVPAKLDGKRLRTVRADVLVAGAETSGTTDIQIRNVTQSADILSTKITIEDDETSSLTATTPPAIDHENSTLFTGDVIAIDIDDVTSTPPKGLIVTMEAY